MLSFLSVVSDLSVLNVCCFIPTLASFVFWTLNPCSSIVVQSAEIFLFPFPSISSLMLLSGFSTKMVLNTRPLPTVILLGASSLQLNWFSCRMSRYWWSVVSPVSSTKNSSESAIHFTPNLATNKIAKILKTSMICCFPQKNLCVSAVSLTWQAMRYILFQNPGCDMTISQIRDCVNAILWLKIKKAFTVFTKFKWSDTAICFTLGLVIRMHLHQLVISHISNKTGAFFWWHTFPD